MSSTSATLALAQDLIRRPSVTPLDEGCQDLMMDRLKAIGFECTPLRFEEVDNFWAVKTGSDGSDAPVLCFAGHTDVVPTGNEDHWTHPPFEARVEGGMLHGRGAADMKGSLAAMVVACENFVTANPNHKNRIAFLITSDEEGPAKNGTVKVMEWLENNGQKIDWCVVGEPSSTKDLGDVVKNGRRGSLGCTLTVKGVQGHVAYPHLAENPIHSAAPALAELAASQWDAGNEFFPPTTFQISNINGGTGATNVIPGDVEVIFNFRFSTETSAEALQSKVEALLNKHELKYDIDWALSGQPFLTSKGELVEATVSAIKAVTGRDTELSTAGGTSDGRFIAPTGAQLVELGPVNATIHKVDECVSAADLDQLTQVYEAVLSELI